MISTAKTSPRGEVIAMAERTTRSESEYHRPVMLEEVLTLLAPEAGRTFVDGTLGGGGHSAALLEAGVRVIALDQDADAIKYATAKLAGWGALFTAVRSNFSRLGEVLDELGIAQIDGGLLDIGVSSFQLDEASRGFSFRLPGRLDMRMDDRAPLTAADLVNTLSAEQLERIFRDYGEEPAARKIAGRITRDRMMQPFVDTAQLAECVESVVPRHGKTHPATRVFQALRIAVNRELDVLQSALEQFTERLAPGGRLGVITFHSLEDRIVKTFLKSRSVEWLDRPEWPEPRRNPDFTLQLVTRKAVAASAAEQRANPRSRSAKLRVAEKLHRPHAH